MSQSVEEVLTKLAASKRRNPLKKELSSSLGDSLNLCVTDEILMGLWSKVKPRLQRRFSSCTEGSLKWSLYGVLVQGVAFRLVTALKGRK